MSQRTRARRRLYTGGALMVLAPIGVASCGGSTSTEDKVAPQDASADPSADSKPLSDAPPEVIAVVPYEDVAPPDAMAIAPADVIVSEPAVDQSNPEASFDGPIAIAPYPDASDEVWDGPMAIMPVPDTGAEGGKGAFCKNDNDCESSLFCDQPMCVIACDPSCQPHPCDPQNPKCDAGSTCEQVGGENLCVRH
ncbi:MAG: hypothetical protein HY898_07195 [Deltaproteobacteria bacterium]|nr:hypothetical protein [Deltaproteobacteria bacterium]